MRQLRRLTLIGLVAIALTHLHSPNVVKAQSKRRPLAAQQIAASATPSVVVLFNLDGNRQVRALGSGFFVASGLVVTNLHVIKGAMSIFGRVVGTEGASRVIEVVITDEDVDLAVLRFESLTGPALPLAAGLPQVGETVYAIGNPKGLEGTFTQGIVSAIRREDGLIQTQVPISPGSSGGPLLNSRGEVVGVAVGTNPDGQNLNFVIPISHVRQLLAVAAANADAGLPEVQPPPASIVIPPPRGDEGSIERAEANRRKAAELVTAGKDRLQSEPDSALQSFRQACEIDRTNAEAHYMIGVMLYFKREYQNSRAALMDCVLIEPEHALAWMLLGRINYSEGSLASAEICLKRAIEHMPNLAQAHELLGTLCRTLGRYNEALDSFRQSIRLDPGSVDAYCGMARIYRFAYSRSDLASELLRQAYDSCRGSDGDYLSLGLEAADIGDRTVALRCYERLKEMNSRLAARLWEELY
jgi:Tfp pilus assembly protein PilF